MGLLGKYNLVPKINMAAVCVAMAFIGAVLIGLV